MDLQAGRRQIQNETLEIFNQNNADLYPPIVDVYTEPPTENLKLEEFEELAIDRVKFLRLLEEASLKGHQLHSENWKTCIFQQLQNNSQHSPNFKKFLRLIQHGSSGTTDLDYQCRRIDRLSHFILRLAYCRSHEMREWFLSREMEWFRWRCNLQTQSDLMEFLRFNELIYVPMTQDEKAMYREQLLKVYGNYHQFDQTEFYKVKFMEVAPMVSNLKAYLKDGYAYIPQSYLVVSIQSKFRTLLSQQLVYFNKCLPQMSDCRISHLHQMLKVLQSGGGAGAYTNFNDAGKMVLPMDQIDAASKIHFPLCMRNIHEQLRANHHLKHFCRLQYGLFLKAAGLQLEEAIEFFRAEFTKTVDDNKFNKQYVYNIKHTYGQVGGRTNYSAYSCVKIVGDSVGQGEHHGCPFMHWTANRVFTKCKQVGLSDRQSMEIKQLVEKEQCQIACTKYFEFVHNDVAPSNPIYHPNQYYKESVELGLKKEK